MKQLVLYCDHETAINVAYNPMLHDQTKHIEIDWFFIKENLSNGSLRINYVKSGDQLAEVFIKDLCNRLFHPSICKVDTRDNTYTILRSVPSCMLAEL